MPGAVTFLPRPGHASGHLTAAIVCVEHGVGQRYLLPFACQKGLDLRKRRTRANGYVEIVWSIGLDSLQSGCTEQHSSIMLRGCFSGAADVYTPMSACCRQKYLRGNTRS